MRRMLGRRLKKLAWVASLVACGMLVALWARSYYVHDALDWGTPSGRAGVFSTDGRLAIGQVRVPKASMGRVPRGLRFQADRSSISELKPSWSSWTGVQVTYVSQLGVTASDVRIPFWMPLVVMGVVALWLGRRLRRPGPSCCPACGYDLRATPNRCPECGTCVRPKSAKTPIDSMRRVVRQSNRRGLS